jgi:hypothetical protein
MATSKETKDTYVYWNKKFDLSVSSFSLLQYLSFSSHLVLFTLRGHFAETHRVGFDNIETYTDPVYTVSNAFVQFPPIHDLLHCSEWVLSERNGRRT